MTSRTYDYILTVANSTNFIAGNTILGLTTLTSGLIANVDTDNNLIKVKVDNTISEFTVGEYVVSNAFTVSSTGNTNAAPYSAPSVGVEVETANTSISIIAPSTYIAEKNAFTQQPIVRLFTVYYPGEWYPPNAAGNPTGFGAGRSWPYIFPLRFAEIRGDIDSDLQYNVTFGTDSYIPYPIDTSGISIDSSGKVNEVRFSVSNYDNLITSLVEDPFIVGNNSSNAVTATVNGELVTGIDPRTVPGHLLYDENIVASRGGTNLAFTYTTTQDVNGTWIPLKIDTRDLLGAVVEIKTTFATFLNYFPEYSTITARHDTALEMYSSLPYRVGDSITINSNINFSANIISIRGNALLLDTFLPTEINNSDKVFIINDQANEDNYVLDTFKINSLDALDEKIATFKLTSWLQYFKLQLPKRKYTKNTCQWVYKGAECQYPDNGSGTIPNSGGTETANGFFTIANVPTGSIDEDVCARNLPACTLRGNQRHFGAMPSTGRTVPK